MSRSSLNYIGVSTRSLAATGLLSAVPTQLRPRFDGAAAGRDVIRSQVDGLETSHVG
jgi:hypothetical protein